MIKNNKAFQKLKHNSNFTSKYQKKDRPTNYRFRYRGANSVGQPYDCHNLCLNKFLNLKTTLNHLMYNIDIFFLCPLTFYICYISPESKGRNSHCQKFCFLLACPPLQHQDLLIAFYPRNSKAIFSLSKFVGLDPSDDDRSECHDHIYPRQFSETRHKPFVEGHCS